MEEVSELTSEPDVSQKRIRRPPKLLDDDYLTDRGDEDQLVEEAALNDNMEFLTNPPPPPNRRNNGTSQKDGANIMVPLTVWYCFNQEDLAPSLDCTHQPFENVLVTVLRGT